MHGINGRNVCSSLSIYEGGVIVVQRISLAHGEGGELTHQLIQEVFMSAFSSKKEIQHDSAVFPIEGKRIAVTTDSYVVQPIFFPGGNIGKLAITGTVNDLAVCCAVPKMITAGFILEEGFALSDLNKIVHSMAEEAKAANVKIVAGDTKVVEKGSADGIFINTTGIGAISEQVCSPAIKKGDCVVVSGTIGDHGIAILSARNQLGLLTDVQSDCASLHSLIQSLLEQVDGIRLMRDPTRGGLATSLVELCEDFQFSVELEEDLIPIRREVTGACNILGFDPLYLANEGKVVIVCDSSNKDKVIEIMQNHKYGEEAKVIGKVISVNDSNGKLYSRTQIGTTRRIHRLNGMILPRIC